MNRITAGSAIVVAVLLSACNLAGDVTPPPGVSTIPRQPTATAGSQQQASIPPDRRPVPQAAADLFAERCAPCHGEAGLGDGPQAVDLPLAPAALADPTLANLVSPGEWYAVVTDGRMDRFMPPFASLTDQQRWDLVAYSMLLSAPSEGVSAGQALYDEVCADCHGPEGEGGGDGPPLADPSFFAEFSRAQMIDVIATGQGSGMPAFADSMSAREIEQLAVYLQTLSLAQPRTEATGPQPDTGVGEAAGTINVTGALTVGDGGQPPPGGVEVTLHGIEGQTEVLTETVEAAADGSYTFSDVAFVPGQLFVVSADYDGVRYASEVLHASESGADLALPLTVFPVSSQAQDVRATRLHLLFDRPEAGRLHLVQLWILVNQGQSTVAPIDGAGGVQIELPRQAENLRFEQAQLADRYQETEAGFRLVAPLRAGGEAEQIVFAVDLPQQLSELVQPMNVPVDAITILVAEGGPRLQADGLIDRGVREAGGERLRQYDIGPLAAGDSLRLRLSGQPLLARVLPADLGWNALIGFLALVAAVGLVAWWYLPRVRAEGSAARRDAADSSQRRDETLMAIARLDQAYEAGELDQEAYLQQRQQLKQRALRLMDQVDD